MPRVEAAFNAGQILRTHVLRPTWHFVPPEDIRWMLALSAPRVHALNAYMYRQTGLDDALLVRAARCHCERARGRHPCTRKELAAALLRSGIEATGLRLGYIMMHAELEGLICSGPLPASNTRMHCWTNARRRPCPQP